MKRWKGPIAVIVALTVAVELVMLVGDAGPAIGLVAALCVLVGIGAWCVFDLISTPTVPAETTRGRFPESTVRTDRRVTRLRHGLTYARRDDGSLVALRDDLVELVDDQLRSVHHVDRATDPERARALIGPDLATFLDDPTSARELAQPRRLDHLLTLIERL